MSDLVSMYTHDKVVAWACVNAILAYCNEPAVLLGEWHKATFLINDVINPVTLARKIQHLRAESGAAPTLRTPW